MVQLAGQARFLGTPENDIVSGTASGDYLFGSDGNDDLSGLGGTDILRGSTGNDILRGGDGSDGLDGSTGNDQLFGEGGHDNLRGGSGRDLLDGGEGNDVLSGGLDQDRLIGGPGADIFMFDRVAASLPGAPDHILDFAPEDRIDLGHIDAQASVPGGQNFVFIGGAPFTGEGQVRVSSLGAATLVEVNTSGAAGAEMVIVLENGAIPTAANFILAGNPSAEPAVDRVIFGDGGNITDPTISVPTADVLFGGAGEDYMNGGALRDEVRGGPGNDIVRGDQSSDILYGDDGHDVLDGYPGNDQLFGGSGNDILRGQQGNDLLDGGPGDDVLDGGTGTDTFSFSGADLGFDTIVDFASGDRIRLDGVLQGFNRSAATVDQFVRFVPLGGDALMQIDADGAAGPGGWTDVALVQGGAGVQAQSLFQAGRLIADNVRPAPVAVDGLSYIASYDDLIRAFGTNVAAGEQHFRQFGQAEGRGVTFDGLQYIAGNRDLILAFGPNATAGAAHYVTNGEAEGRDRDAFDEVRYVAQYDDLRAAFGTDYDAATLHFITHGSAEGRTGDFLL